VRGSYVKSSVYSGCQALSFWLFSRFHPLQNLKPVITLDREVESPQFDAVLRAHSASLTHHMQTSPCRLGKPLAQLVRWANVATWTQLEWSCVMLCQVLCQESREGHQLFTSCFRLLPLATCLSNISSKRLTRPLHWRFLSLALARIS